MQTQGIVLDLHKDAFEVKIKGEHKITIELHLKMCMVVHLLGHRRALNESIKT